MFPSNYRSKHFLLIDKHFSNLKNLKIILANQVRLWDVQTQKCLASKSILRNVVTNMCAFDRKTFVQVFDAFLKRSFDGSIF